MLSFAVGGLTAPNYSLLRFGIRLLLPFHLADTSFSNLLRSDFLLKCKNINDCRELSFGVEVKYENSEDVGE